MLSTAARLRRSTRSSCARSESSPRRTPIEMSKTNGKKGRSMRGATGVISSGTRCRGAK